MITGVVTRAYLQPLVPRLLLLDMLLHTPDRHTVVFFQPHRRRLDNVGFR